MSDLDSFEKLYQKYKDFPGIYENELYDLLNEIKKKFMAVKLAKELSVLDELYYNISSLLDECLAREEWRAATGDRLLK